MGPIGVGLVVTTHLLLLLCSCFLAAVECQWRDARDIDSADDAEIAAVTDQPPINVNATEVAPEERLLPAAVVVDFTKCGLSSVDSSRLDMVSNNARLVGGIETIKHAWPWAAQLTTSGRHQCGAALIHPSFVLTAAHCFARTKNSEHYKVLLGGHAIYSGRQHDVWNVSVHPAYHVRESAFDVALLRIHPPANLSAEVRTICLPALPALPQQMCVACGWGRLKENGERANELREIHIPIIHHATCNDARHYAGRVHVGSMICAGFNTGRIDACQGDSGGPLQCQNANGVWELQGVVSWGIGCAQPNYPGVYARVHAMAPWVRAQMRLLDPTAIV